MKISIQNIYAGMDSQMDMLANALSAKYAEIDNRLTKQAVNEKIKAQTLISYYLWHATSLVESVDNDRFPIAHTAWEFGIGPHLPQSGTFAKLLGADQKICEDCLQRYMLYYDAIKGGIDVKDLFGALCANDRQWAIYELINKSLPMSIPAKLAPRQSHFLVNEDHYKIPTEESWTDYDCSEFGSAGERKKE